MFPTEAPNPLPSFSPEWKAFLALLENFFHRPIGLPGLGFHFSYFLFQNPTIRRREALGERDSREQMETVPDKEQECSSPKNEGQRQR